MARAPNYQKELHKLADFVASYLTLLDEAMKLPSTEARGKRIAELSNKLELKNDTVRRFVLEVDRNGRKLKRAALTRETTMHNTGEQHGT